VSRREGEKREARWTNESEEGTSAGETDLRAFVVRQLEDLQNDLERDLRWRVE